MKRHRDFGERVAGAAVGAAFGLFLGVLAMLIVHIITPANGSQFRVLWATIAYCAAFTFIFGEELADVLASFARAIGILLGLVAGDSLVDPDSSWPRAWAVFLLFIAPLIAIIYLVHQ